jgi:hypothetical protein
VGKNAENISVGNNQDRVSQELLERMRKRRCFADKELEELSPPQELQRQKLIELNGSSSLQKPTQQQSSALIQKQTEKPDHITYQSSFVDMINNEVTLNSIATPPSTSAEANSVDAFNTFISSLAYLSNIFQTSAMNSENLSYEINDTNDRVACLFMYKFHEILLKNSLMHQQLQQQQQQQNLLNSAIEQESAFCVPKSTINRTNESIAPSLSIKEACIESTNKLNDLILHLNDNDANQVKSIDLKLHNHLPSIQKANNVSKKNSQSSSKLTNFSVEALLGVVK